VGIGIFFGVLASVCFSLSNLIEKLAVDRMPAISPGRAVHMFQHLCRSKLWLAGFAVGVIAVGLMVVAYALTPVAVAQSIFGAGLVVIVVASRVMLHESIRRKEWVGLTAILVAVVLVSLTLGSSKSVGTQGSLVAVVVTSGVTVVVAAAGFFLLRGTAADHSVSFGVTAGLLYGVGALQLKSASVLLVKHGLIDSIPRTFATPYPYVFILASLLGLSIFQTGLQRSRVAVVAPLTNVVASVYVVAIGMAVFNEPLPTSTASAAMRFIGFALVLVGSWFLSTGPASMRVPGANEMQNPLTLRVGESE
jgi:drug/metabolite transporter (DMT)-like permease